MIGITYADLFLKSENGLVEFLKYEIYQKGHKNIAKKVLTLFIEDSVSTN